LTLHSPPRASPVPYSPPVAPRRRRPPPPLFPYTTLFRSLAERDGAQDLGLRRQLVEHVGLAAAQQKRRDPLREALVPLDVTVLLDRKSTRLNSSHVKISYAVFCLKKKTMKEQLWRLSKAR